MKTDIEIARETKLNKIEDIAEKLGVPRDEVQNYGRYIAKVPIHLIDKKEMDKHNLILVSAITPNKAGVGKTTVSIGLSLGLNKIGKKAVVALREPSLGPCFGMKGGAAGGGYSQVLPMENINLHFTGDFHAVTSAHNMITALLDNYIYQNRNSCEGLKEVKWKRVLDVNDRSLRNIVSGLGGSANGIPTETGFDITAASEIMSIMSLARDLPDLRKRLSRVVLAFDRAGNPVTTADLEVDGAMMAWLLEASKPNLIQTIEGQPVLVHAGPFGNIALGQSSIIADRVALKLSDIHVTESGFGSEIGYEKFWNVKCHMSGLKPDAAVIVATVRALKNHGGAQPPMPGRPLPEPYTREDVGLVEAGCVNLLRHIGIVRRSGVSPVVCINAFATDSKNEIAAIRRICEEAGARVALSEHWLKGGDGALELADAVMDACNEPNNFAPLYDWSMPFEQRIETIAKEVYGADGVEFSSLAKQRIKELQARPDAEELGICMVKTQYSLSDNPALKGAPTGWRLHVRDCLFYGGAGLVVPVAGDISLMPGTGSRPAFRNVDVDLESGQVTGLF